MPHQSVKASLSRDSRQDGRGNYLDLEAMVKEGIIQVDETEKMAHGREHALADMISSTFQISFQPASLGGVGNSDCQAAVTLKGHQHTLETCPPPTRRS